MFAVIAEAIRGLPLPTGTGTRAAAIGLALLTTGYGDLYIRVAEIEDRMDRQELVSRYTGCILREFVEDRAPDACDVLVEADVIDYLRPQPRGAR